MAFSNSLGTNGRRAMIGTCSAHNPLPSRVLAIINVMPTTSLSPVLIRPSIVTVDLQMVVSRWIGFGIITTRLGLIVFIKTFRSRVWHSVSEARRSTDVLQRFSHDVYWYRQTSNQEQEGFGGIIQFHRVTRLRALNINYNSSLKSSVYIESRWPHMRPL